MGRGREGRKCMADRSCLVIQIRVSGVISAVSESSSYLLGRETSLQTEMSFITVNFLCRRGNPYTPLLGSHGGVTLPQLVLGEL